MICTGPELPSLDATFVCGELQSQKIDHTHSRFYEQNVQNNRLLIQRYLAGFAKDKGIRLIKRRRRDGWVGFHYRLHMTVDGCFSPAECRLKRTAAAITTQKWPVAADPAV